MVFFVHIVYELLFAFLGLTPSEFHRSLKAPKISVVLFVYIVYKRLLAFPRPDSQ